KTNPLNGNCPYQAARTNKWEVTDVLASAECELAQYKPTAAERSRVLERFCADVLRCNWRELSDGQHRFRAVLTRDMPARVEPLRVDAATNDLPLTGRS